MTEKTEAVVLGRVKHSDTLTIISLFTEKSGRVSVTSHGGVSRAARLRNARMMPLSLVEVELSVRPGRELQSLRSVSPISVYRDLYSDPVKSAVGMFIAEFLTKALRESAADEQLWRYIRYSLEALDATPVPENFHLAFLAGIARYLGVSPDVSAYSPDRYFDMRAGAYVDFCPVHRDFLAAAEAALPLKLSKLNYRNTLRLRLSGDRRYSLLCGMLRYYSLHIPGIDNMKSPEVLHTLFR